MFMVEEDMDLVCARETVTATPNAKEASSANRETDTLASVDAMAEAKKTGTTASSLEVLLLETSMSMEEESMVSDSAREIVTATPNAKRVSSANRETDTLVSVDAVEEERKTGITVLSLLLLSKPMLEDWLIIELLLKDTELSRLPVLEPISVEDTLLLLRKELLLVPEHLKPTE